MKINAILANYRMFCSNHLTCTKDLNYFKNNTDYYPGAKPGVIMYHIDYGSNLSSSNDVYLCKSCVNELFNVLKAELKLKVFE